MAAGETKQRGSATVEPDIGRAAFWRTEDAWAITAGLTLLALVVLRHYVPTLARAAPAIPDLGAWRANPLDSLLAGSSGQSWALALVSLAGLVVLLAGLVALSLWCMGSAVRPFVLAVPAVFGLAIVAKIVSRQQSVHQWGLDYPLWAIGLGLLWANTLGTPQWVLAGIRSELCIKIGLVLLGSEILFGRILQVGAPAIAVAWLVTPLVIVFMWNLGRRGLRIESPRLVMVIACATSVCGVSAAIASAAACRAKKEELTLAVGMSLIFTVIMMVGMPAAARAMGLDVAVAGAWIGGTVDSTGAVVAAGALLGDTARDVAAVVKMIQNMMIGLVAFLIAVYWVTSVERDAAAPRPSPLEIWRRFPKFVLGFLGASLLVSFLIEPAWGAEATKSDLTSFTKALSGWWFALAFAGIGLESDFRRLASHLAGGRAIVLYLIGQSFNVALTLVVAYLAFGRFAPLAPLETR